MSSELRQRKKPSASASATEGESAPFQDQKSNDAALQTPPQEEDKNDASLGSSKGLTLLGRLVLFLGVPLIIGVAGLYTGYLRGIQDPSRKVDFDNDFIFPFLVALSMAIVVGFQTKGYTTTQLTPLIQWPKVRRKKKFILKRVIVEDGEKSEDLSL